MKIRDQRKRGQEGRLEVVVFLVSGNLHELRR